MLRAFITLCTAIMILFALSMITSCSDHGAGSEGEEGAGEGCVNNSSREEILIPETDSFSKDAVPFEDITYARPNVDVLAEKYAAASVAVLENTMPFSEQLELVKSAEEEYDNFVTQYVYLTLLLRKDSLSESQAEEYEMLSLDHPAVTRLRDELMTAAARSPHAVRYESEYFGAGFINNYRNGSPYTDDTVALFEDEKKLLNSYATISGANVVITWEGITDTYDHTIIRLKNKYAKNSPAYIKAMDECRIAYETRVTEINTETLISLLKVRKRIADELGYSSYTEYAYDTVYHDYSVNNALNFIKDVSEYLVPVYNKTYFRVLRDYENPPSNSLDNAALINTFGEALRNYDDELWTPYSYMLSYGLFDVGKSGGDRFDGSFTAYLSSYDSPYLFATVDGSAMDYMTLAHEFGHFYDMFANGGSETSIDLAEVSSESLELLLLTVLDDHLSAAEYKYLYHAKLNDAMSSIIMQSFYSAFEHMAYELSYYDITKRNLDECVQEAARMMSLSDKKYSDISAVLIPHFFYEPFYVQSYGVSQVVALDIFFEEMQTPGKGLDIYKNLVRRTGGGSFEDHLKGAKLASPFLAETVKRVSDGAHYYVFGSHYYEEYKNSTVQRYASIPVLPEQIYRKCA